MPVATPVPYTTSPSPTIPVVISLSIYLTALLISACVIQYLHHRSNPPPHECHSSRPLALMNLPSHPRPTLNQSGFLASPPLEFTPYSPSLSPLPSSSSLSKDSLVTRPTSPANSSSNSYTSSPSCRSNTSEPVLMTYLATLASHFAPPSLSSSDQFLNCSTPTPSTATWKSSQAKSYSQRSCRSTTPSPEQSNNTTEDKQDSTPPLLPFPWPFKSHHVPCHLLPPQ